MKQILALLILICCQYGLVYCQNNNQKQTKEKHESMNDSLKYESRSKALGMDLRRKGIRDELVLEAITKVPRHLFVEERLASRAYEDRPLPIDKNQTISQPYTVAFQTELLQLEPDDKVLEIGTGSGYQAAVLCEMEMNVYSIERHYQLYLKAKDVLTKLGYQPQLFYGDGYEGLPDHSPFDKILITAATKEFPRKLLEQLKIGGLMVAPIGDNYSQTMTVIERISATKYKESKHGDFVFVPMVEGVEE